MDLPNEMWRHVLLFLKYNDVFISSLVCKRFHLISLSYPDYKDRLVMSRSILRSDTDEVFEFVKKCLDEVSENIWLGFSGLFKSRQYLKSILNIKRKRIRYELLPFKVHEHLFPCQRGIRDAGRCNFCTRFFLENCDETILIKMQHICSHTNVPTWKCILYSLFKKVQTSDVYLNIFYKASDLISHGPKNYNYGEMFTELINNPFSLNILKDVTDFVVLK